MKIVVKVSYSRVPNVNGITVKLGDKERFEEQIGVKEPFPVTNCQFNS